MRILTLEEVIAAGGSDIAQACAEVEKGFEIFHKKGIVQPFKTHLKQSEETDSSSQSNKPHSGFVNIMPAIVTNDESEIYGCKLLGAMISNKELGLPRATGLIVLFDPQTKIPKVIMDAQVISAIRTGAVSGVAAKYLAPKVTESVGLIGAGMQMRTQLLAVLHTLPHLKRAVVYSRGDSKHRFAAEMSARTGKEIVAADSVETLVKGNPFIITCVPMTPEPVFQTEWLPSRGTTIFNIGGVNTPLTALPLMDRLIADSWDDSKHRGTQSLPLAVSENIIDETSIENLSHIVANNDGRRTAQENIFFCPVGMAFEDIIVANRVYQMAVQQNIGHEIDLWQNAEWI